MPRPLIDHNIHAPSFFTQEDLLKLLKQAEKSEDLFDMLVDELTMCDKLSLELMEKIPHTAGESPEQAQCEAIQIIADQLEYIVSVLHIAELMKDQELYAWTLPRTDQGIVDREKEITSAETLPFSYRTHVIGAIRPSTSDDQVYDDEMAECPDSNVMFFDQDYRELAEPMMVGEVMQDAIGEPEDLDRSVFNNAIASLHAFYTGQKDLLDRNDTCLPSILKFFEEEQVKKICQPRTISLN